MTFIPKADHSKLTVAQIAYFAGIVDGEGYVGVTRYRTGRKLNPIGYRVALSIAMTDERVIDWLATTFGGTHGIYRTAGIAKPVHQWMLRTADAASLLALALPYLIVKKEQARLIITFAETLSWQGKRQRVTEVNDYRASLYERSRLLNRRGAA